MILDQLPAVISRQNIMALEERLIAEFGGDVMGEDDFDDYLMHTFAPGVYTRQIHIPAGMVVVGKIHMHSHVNIISVGDVSVATEFGRNRYLGPHTFVSERGTKRVVFAHTDTLWTTVHLNPTDERDVKILERSIIAPTYNDFDRLNGD